MNSNYLPVWLQEAGYNTYYTGKLFNSHTIANYDSPYPAGWTSTDFLLDPGTYSYLSPIYQHDHDPPVHHQNEHTSDLITAKAQSLLSQALASGKPFFLGVAPVAPHSDVAPDRHAGVPRMTEPVPAARHAHLFPDARVPRGANFNPDRPSGASWVRGLPRHDAASVAYLDHYHRQRLRALQAVDELVGALVARLGAAGALGDTYVVYSSDNGFHLGQHRLPPGKECGYEEDVRVPLLVRGPGVPRGRVEEAVTTHIDLAPTILEMVGVGARPDFDGAAIPLAAGGDEEEDVLGDAAGSRKSRGAAWETKRHEHVAVEYWGFALAEGEGGGFGECSLGVASIGKGNFFFFFWKAFVTDSWLLCADILFEDGNDRLVALNNTYKAVRIIGEGYDLYYSVWCNNEHELYDIKVGLPINPPPLLHQERTMKKPR